MITPTSDDPSALRRAFSGFPCGVAALSAVVAGEPHVLVASSFTVGVSQAPPLVLFAVQHSSTTWPALSAAPTLGVSVLGTSHADVTRQLAAKDKAARLAGVATTTVDGGALFLEGAPIWLECSIWDTHPAGDHDIVVLRVLGLRADFEHHPLVWHRSQFATLAS